MKTAAVKELEQGLIFKYGGNEWCLLDHLNGGTLAVSAENLGTQFWDVDGEKDYKKSLVRKWLVGSEKDKEKEKIPETVYEKLLRSGVRESDLIKMSIDITTADGDKVFGTDEAYIGLMTENQHKYYRDVISECQEPFWLVTAGSNNAFYIGLEDSQQVRYVQGCGTRDWRRPDEGRYGIRPVICLKNDVVVEIKASVMIETYREISYLSNDRIFRRDMDILIATEIDKMEDKLGMEPWMEEFFLKTEKSFPKKAIDMIGSLAEQCRRIPYVADSIAAAEGAMAGMSAEDVLDEADQVILGDGHSGLGYAAYALIPVLNGKLEES